MAALTDPDADAGTVVEQQNGEPQSSVQPRRFTGFARVGSRVELFINDRLIATEEVLTDHPEAPPDEGVWEFKNVTLPPGTTNEIRIVITEPSGIRYQTERTVISSSVLLRKGQSAVAFGMGTNRSGTQWRSRGFLMGTRLYHGISDALTLGVMAGLQNSFNEPDPLSLTDPPIPRRSGHYGMELSWQPRDNLLASAQAALCALSETATNDATSDFAAVVNARYSPLANVNFTGRVFRYGSDFFNGVNTRPRDRQGAAASARWTPLRDWTLNGAAGCVNDNVDGTLDNTTRLDYETLSLSSNAIPRTTVTLQADRIGYKHGIGRKPALHGRGHFDAPAGLANQRTARRRRHADAEERRGLLLRP